MRVLMSDCLGEPDIERLALPGLRVDSLPLALGRAPTVADLLAAVEAEETPVLIAWYGLPFAAPTIVALAELKSRVASYEYAVLAHAEEVQVGADTGCTSTGVWAANATRSPKNVSAAQVRLATALETRWHRVRDALAAGSMNADQVRVVVNALEDLPDDLPTSGFTTMRLPVDTTGAVVTG